MSFLVIYNPICGDGTAGQFFEQNVIPLLQKHGRKPDTVIATTHAGHSGEIIVEAFRSFSGPLSIVLGSGDGTLHEIITALNNSTLNKHAHALSIALVPCGTANALYSSLFPPNPHSSSDAPSYKLQSLHALLSPSPSSFPLTLAITSVSSGAPQIKELRTSISAVVASTALHASILHDSEELRASIPSLDRFKIAAQQNITRWYHAGVKLSPSTRMPSVLVYDPDKAHFVPSGEGPIELDGPFAYFLSTVNVDRLEPTFRIAPLYQTIRPQDPALDIVIIRPLRDPSVHDESEESRARFARKSGAVLGGAYQDGAHINMRYGDDGSIKEEQGKGSTIAEYYRCGEWEWVPNPTDDSAHLVCADGEILRIDEGGKASCSAVKAIHNVQLSIFV